MTDQFITFYDYRGNTDIDCSLTQVYGKDLLQYFDNDSLNCCVIDNFDMNTFQSNIDLWFSRLRQALHFKFSLLCF